SAISAVTWPLGWWGVGDGSSVTNSSCNRGEKLHRLVLGTQRLNKRDPSQVSVSALLNSRPPLASRTRTTPPGDTRFPFLGPMPCYGDDSAACGPPGPPRLGSRPAPCCHHGFVSVPPGIRHAGPPSRVGSPRRRGSTQKWLRPSARVAHGL